MTIRRPRFTTPQTSDAPVRSNVWRSNRPNPDEVAAQGTCVHKTGCGSCAILTQNYDIQLQKKYEAPIKVMKELGVLDHTRVLQPLASPKRLHYRTHAKLTVRAKKNEDGTNGWAIGMFAPNSHDVVEADNCALHKESINRLLRDLRPLLAASLITPYDEKTGTGDMRYLAIRASHHTDEVLVTFVMNNADYEDSLKSMMLQLRRQDHRIVGAAINVNPTTGNAIFSNETKSILGSEFLRERICDLDFAVAPTTFFQVNPWQAEQIYRRIENLAGSSRYNETAWDLYCGVGQITSLIARKGFRTFGIEENPESIRWATHNMNQNQLQAEFIAARTEDVLHVLPLWAANPKLIVANPSRRGMHETVVEQIAQKIKENTATFIYMSCAAESLGRDLRLLVNAGLKVRQLEAFDMFPYTDKLEWLAVVTP